LESKRVKLTDRAGLSTHGSFRARSDWLAIAEKRYREALLKEAERLKGGEK